MKTYNFFTRNKIRLNQQLTYAKRREHIGIEWREITDLNLAMFTKIVYNFHKGISYFDQVDFHPNSGVSGFGGII